MRSGGNKTLVGSIKGSRLMLLYLRNIQFVLDIFVYGNVQLCLDYPNGKGNMEIS